MRCSARSALVSLTATAIALALGVPLGTWLALARTPRAPVAATVVNTGMAVPTVVVGLVVALLLWRSGPLGHLELIYTLRGMIIAQVLIAAPLIAGITMAGAAGPAAGPRRPAAGARREQAAAGLRLWIEARVPLLAAAMAGFGHAISEVGAGDDRGRQHPRPDPGDDHLDRRERRRGDFDEALVYAAILLGLAFTINALLTSVQQRAAAWAQS